MAVPAALETPDVRILAIFAPQPGGTPGAVLEGMKTKVHGGTAIHGESSLCATCHYATIIRGRALDEEIVECGVSSLYGRRIPFKVTSCTAYSDARLPSFGEMVKTAWILRPHSKRRAAGFIRGSDLRGEELREVLSDEPAG